MSNDNLKKYKQVLRPIIFLDLFSFPPTAWELWQYLDKKQSLLDVEKALKELVEKKVLQELQGFYFLFGREKLVSIRQHRYNYSAAKIRKARIFSKVFSIFPGVLMVSAANFIGSHNWRQDSDIDFFIITKEKYLWRSRLFCAGITKLMFSRPTEKSKKDKICLSFYVSESALNLKSLELEGGDPYFEYWKRGLLPLYAHGDIWNRFQEENSESEKDSLNENVYDREFINNKLGFFENIAKKIQLLIMPTALREAMKKSEGVVINDRVLKLYLREKRRDFREDYNNKKYEIFKTLN